MKSVMSLFVATAFVMTCAAGIAQQPPASHIRVTEKTAKKMAQTAKTPEQYRATAECYRELHDDYENKANIEKSQWILESQRYPWLKNPSPESARGLYEYYNSKTVKMSALSSKYSKMADSAPASPHN